MISNNKNTSNQYKSHESKIGEWRHDHEHLAFINKGEVKFFKTRTFIGEKIFREKNHETQGLNFFE